MRFGVVQYKVAVVGDGAVGKSSIISRFTADKFAASYKQTLGMDFARKTVQLPGDVRVTLQLWDIGGQSIGSKNLRNLVFGSDAILLVYDVTSYQSFLNLEDWMRIIQKTYADTSDEVVLALVGNKTDLSHVRTVKIDKHETWAFDHRASSMFMSAKTGDNLNNSFTRLAAKLADVHLSRPEVDAAAKVVEATIINHDALPAAEADVTAPTDTRGKKKKGCILM